ncbi:MAG: hypothetical protein AB1505_13675, partial [Candidatus Latescibacterota bacterium]
MAERHLIFAPHPDDEQIGCAGVIVRAVRAGDGVRSSSSPPGRCCWPCAPGAEHTHVGLAAGAEHGLCAVGGSGGPRGG